MKLALACIVAWLFVYAIAAWDICLQASGR